MFLAVPTWSRVSISPSGEGKKRGQVLVPIPHSIVFLLDFLE